MKRILCVVMSLIMCAMLLTACHEESVPLQDKIDVTGMEKVNVVIMLKGGDEMTLELYPKIAPVTVQNFVDLATSGFYDGLIFHRIIEDFVVQGGDPNGDGTGGSSTNIKGEFSENGFENTLKHEKGVISMARSNDYNSASSQFFICTSNNANVTNLDGQYAAFGKLTKGWDVLEKLNSVKTDDNDKPKTDIVIKAIRVAE